MRSVCNCFSSWLSLKKMLSFWGVLNNSFCLLLLAEGTICLELIVKSKICPLEYREIKSISQDRIFLTRVYHSSFRYKAVNISSVSSPGPIICSLFLFFLFLFFSLLCPPLSLCFVYYKTLPASVGFLE